MGQYIALTTLTITMGLLDCLIFCVAIGGYSIHYIATGDLELSNISRDEVAASRVVSSTTLIMFRLFCMLVVICTNAYILLDKVGLTLTVLSRNGQPMKVHIKHLERFTTFTVWSWSFIGIYFAVASYCTFSSLLWPDSEIPLPVLQMAWVLFEVHFATSLLITVLVTFVLIPAGKARGLPTHTWFEITPLLMHNLNILVMVVESLLNDLPYKLNHIPFAILYGLAYVAFSWVWFEYKGIFYYFFLDYARPWALAWYAGVVLVVSSCPCSCWYPHFIIPM